MQIEVLADDEEHIEVKCLGFPLFHPFFAFVPLAFSLQPKNIPLFASSCYDGRAGKSFSFKIYGF
jgi:hypothetical protein